MANRIFKMGGVPIRAVELTPNEEYALATSDAGGSTIGAVTKAPQNATIAHSVVAASTVNAALCAASATRLAVAFMNTGSVDVYIEPDALTTVATAPILLVSGGGAFIDDYGGTAYSCITASGTSTVGVTIWS